MNIDWTALLALVCLGISAYILGYAVCEKRLEKNKNTSWKAMCEGAVKKWEKYSDKKYPGGYVVFHPVTFRDALSIRQYMEANYPNIDIFIIIDGFVYSTELKGKN